MTNQKYQFTNGWFEQARPLWVDVLKQTQPNKILEIGSYEGACTCFLIDTIGQDRSLEIHCIDTWQGGKEHEHIDMMSVEQRFIQNTAMSLSQAKHASTVTIHRGTSAEKLCQLVAEGKSRYFDLIYIDGSHQAPDVLMDAVASFQLLSVGGLMIFDDYLWSDMPDSQRDPLMMPKPAIDSFINIYMRKMKVLQAHLFQLYVQKISD
jgi:predicted O-methyltransferase YrrM